VSLGDFGNLPKALLAYPAVARYLYILGTEAVFCLKSLSGSVDEGSGPAHMGKVGYMGVKTEGSDRRKTHRLDSRLEVNFSDGRSLFKEVVLDLSSGGLQAEAPRQLDVGTELQLRSLGIPYFFLNRGQATESVTVPTPHRKNTTHSRPGSKRDLSGRVGSYRTATSLPEG
jgi:hypothetical protein